MRDFLTGLLGFFFLVLVVAGVVVGLTQAGFDVGVRPTTHDKFVEACSKVKGTAVWNGRHWECLK